MTKNSVFLPEGVSRSRFGQALRGLNTSVATGGSILIIVAIIALFAPFLATHDPSTISPANRLASPSAQNWFGTDAIGRDIYSRVIYGARISLLIGLGATALTTLIGLTIGLLAGSSRILDSILMRIVDGMMAIPPVLLAIALMALTKGSVYTVVFAISVAEVPRMARLVRGVVLSLGKQLYVEAAISAGASSRRVILVHILPNSIGPVVVQATYVFASAMIIEAILSFLGAGVPPSIPSWGNIMADGRQLWLVKPNMIFFPAFFLSLTVLAMNVMGDGLRTTLDPRSRTR